MRVDSEAYQCDSTVAEKTADIDSVTDLGANPPQYFIRIDGALNLNGNAQLTASDITAHQWTGIFFGQTQQALTEILEPGRIRFWQHQAQGKAKRRGGHGRKVAEVHGQCPPGDQCGLGRRRKMDAGKQRVHGYGE